MRIVKLLSRFIICILCVFCISSVSFAEEDLPIEQEAVSEQVIEQETPTEEEPKSLLDSSNIQMFNQNISNDLEHFQPNMNLDSKTFVPIEARIGLMLMKALSAVDVVLQISLVRFAVIFLLFMYVFWVGLEAYKLIRDSGDYKQAFYNIFKQGITIGIWIMILQYGPAKIFGLVVSPILSLGSYLSDFILGAVAETYKVNIPDTCGAIHNYVNTNQSLKLLVDPDTAANIMCLPSRISIYFYHATATAFQWIKYGLGHSVTMVIVGIVSIVIFVKCIFKYAFMTLGVVADLFLRLLMLPFTALAESVPSSSEKNIPGQVFNGFLKIFNTQKLSGVLSTFINAAVYFVSLSIIIAICAVLLTNIISLDGDNNYSVGSAITTIISGCFILYITKRTDSLAAKLGGGVNNAFGEQMQTNAKILWNKTKQLTTNLVNIWLKNRH